ncbi:MAG: class D sortase [Clostridia bacterium]|nr:class D sortase [Clostridia bacterium]
MVKPTARNINLLTIVISVIMFCLVNGLYVVILNNNKLKFQVNINSPKLEQMSIKEENKKSEINKDKSESKTENIEEKTENTDANWTIEIPEINLIAEISEGTSKEVMDKYVGHFDETKVEYGNIGLAAHNRGYPVNYFQDLKKLKEGSEIIYKHKDFTMVYEVKKHEIIENTNWEYLKNTEDNRITLITCVENEPQYRRCIQGVEKIESEE